MTAVPFRRAGALGRLLLPTPVQFTLQGPFRLPGQLFDALAAPVRVNIARDVRRTLGLPGQAQGGGSGRAQGGGAGRAGRGPRSEPNGRPFLPPDAVTRRIHGDLASMVVGGLSALLLQTLHPLAMAGVAEHSGYDEDPIGRLRRTAWFVARTTFGSRDEARAAIRQVQQVHRRVHGVAPDGRHYSAADPELVTWVHVAETSTFLRAAERFGPGRLGAAERDRYFAETGAVAYALGAEWVPSTADEAAAYFGRVRPELYAGPQALAARDFLLRGVASRPEDRAVYAVIAAAAVSLLPGWARSELHIPAPPLLDAVVIVPLARALCGGLRWAVAPGSPPRAA